METPEGHGRFDVTALAAPGEPVFVLAGRDPHAPHAVEAWAFYRAEAISRGIKPRSDIAQVREALRCAAAMRLFRTKRTGEALVPSALAHETEALLRRLEGDA